MHERLFDPHLYIKQIILVGLGGTGSHWARLIARMLYALKENGQNLPRVKFVDPDIVESKNVGRQLFTPAEIGKSKAEVLAYRYNCALGLEIEAIPETFSSSGYGERFGNTVICGAVDNANARNDIAQAQNAVWIDAGNHRSSGQVTIGNCSSWEQITREWDYNDKRVSHIPSPALIFPELIVFEIEPEDEISCADLQINQEQSLLINGFMAQIGSDYLYKLLHREPISTFMTTFNSQPLAMRSYPITRSELEVYHPMSVANTHES